MKKLPVYFILVALISLSFGFTSNEIDNKPKAKSPCPYIQDLTKSDCPYLNGKADENYLNEKNNQESECPYINKMKENKSGCPYIDGKSNKQSKFKSIKDNWKAKNS
jgi:hypothetical protein